MKRFAIVSVFVGGLGIAPANAADVDWQAAAQQDLTAMHELLRENHPAMYVDKDSAHFRAWLDDGLKQAEAKLPQVRDERGYYFLLHWYATGFRDGHINAGMKDSAFNDHLTLAWPGFSTAWRDGKYVVAYVLPEAAKSAPPLAATLISCDGKSAEEIARARLDLYETNLDLEGGRYMRAAVLLWDQGNPFQPALFHNCRFQTNGRVKNYRLVYRSDPDSALAEATEAAVGKKGTLDVQPWGDKGWWRRIPSMGDDQDWQGFYAKVDANIDSIRNAGIVVIDVRHNGGGSSQYAEMLADKFYGKDFVNAHFPQLGDVVYRASPLNRDFLKGLADHFAKDPLNQDAAKELSGEVAGIDKAMAAGQATYTEKADATPPFDPAKAKINVMKGKLIILTDSFCGSACLDLMDLFLAFPNAEQAGLTTSADTIFMELTMTGLPSGQGRFVFGHKAWIERPRGSNVPYTPRPGLTYHGDLNDDAAVRAWLAKAVQ